MGQTDRVRLVRQMDQMDQIARWLTACSLTMVMLCEKLYYEIKHKRICTAAEIGPR